nr:MAG TPA: hypothetical protein [Caudoviricetes sp.]
MNRAAKQVYKVIVKAFNYAFILYYYLKKVNNKIII